MPELSEQECHEVEGYLYKALVTCGKKLLLGLLFDDDPLCDFEEDIQELRFKGHEHLIRSARSEFAEVANMRRSAKNMLEMTNVYAIEDESEFSK